MHRHLPTEQKVLPDEIGQRGQRFDSERKDFRAGRGGHRVNREQSAADDVQLLDEI